MNLKMKSAEALPAFSLFGTPLEGRHLIESSAGTGKTYTITSLLLRLLLEKNIPLHRILIVTFTKAATEDLKKRARRRIMQAIGTFEQGPGKDEFLNELHQRWEGTPDSAARILKDALLAFDEAAIFTIHGFCQRVLADNAFESRSFFDTEVLTDQRQLRQEIVDDYWRLSLLKASPMFVDYFLSRKEGIDSLLSFARLAQRGREMRVIPAVSPTDAAALELKEKSFLECFSQIRTAWKEEGTAIREMLQGEKIKDQLNQKSYGPGQLVLYLAELESYLNAPPTLFIEDKGEKLAASKLEKGTKKNATTPRHALFDWLDQLLEQTPCLIEFYEQQRLALKAGLLEFIGRESNPRRLQRNVRTFDDLLADLEEALRGPVGEELKKALDKHYQVALIDEFQDTDPLQNAIFDKLFHNEGQALFLIGDPKQAIYNFRGADIFSYLAASQATPDRHSLGKNWRSSELLIRAINSLFGNVSLPFVLPQISFAPVETGKEEANRGLLIDGQPDPSPFKVWFLQRPPDAAKKLMPKEKPLGRIPSAVADEIMRLLKAGQEGGIQVEGGPLKPGDIAVLVLNNQQAREIQQALSAVRIPSVLYTTGSVFQTKEATELDRVLSAILEPSRERLLRAALSTSLLGVNGEEIASLEQEEESWEARVQRMLEYRVFWEKESFMVMARRLIGQEAIRPRLLIYPDGERRLTNLLQCVELVQQASSEHHLGLEGALKWLRSRIAEDHTVPPEEYQTRLETDEQAVKVVTIHRSKGLEYPIVFCPYHWYVREDQAEEEILFHACPASSQVTLDMGSPEIARHRMKAREEAISENARLLYVALTRAKYRCYLVWGAISNASRAALSLLLHSPEMPGEEGWLENFTIKFKQTLDEQIRTDLEGLAKRSGKAIEILPFPESTRREFAPPTIPPGKFACRTFKGEISSDWGIASFTSLVSGKREVRESADRDARISTSRRSFSPPLAESATAGTGSFLGGVRAGNFFHALFEQMDFVRAEAECSKEYLTKRLKEFGYEADWAPEVRRIVLNVLCAPLGREGGEFQLAQISSQRRRHEVEFTLPLEQLTPGKLAAAFQGIDSSALPEDVATLLRHLEFRPIRGQLHGFIDLLFEKDHRFYIVDWKSNFLGPKPEDYLPEKLSETMLREYYFLQYYLYTAAMHRHLTNRLNGYDYESHFGGVYYLFIRGINPAAAPGNGVFFDRPSAEVVRSLLQLF